MDEKTPRRRIRAQTVEMILQKAKEAGGRAIFNLREGKIEVDFPADGKAVDTEAERLEAAMNDAMPQKRKAG